MPGGGGLQPELDMPVLVAGDAEADLAPLLAALRLPEASGVSGPSVAPNLEPSLAHGVPAACAALRLAEFAVVVADVATLDGAMALLRAAGRGRPAARVICLLPAHFPMDGQDTHGLPGHPVAHPMAHVERAAFAVRRHPVSGADLRALTSAAAADYAAARRRWGVVRGDRERWSEAEQLLTDALHQLVVDLSGQRSTSETASLIERCVSAAARAARSGDDGPALLRLIAGALAGEDTRKTEDAA